MRKRGRILSHSAETPGEDPYLTGEYAIYYTKGMQIAEEDPYHVQASACCKHYVANSMEGTTQRDGEKHDRQHVDSIVPMQVHLMPSVPSSHEVT